MLRKLQDFPRNIFFLQLFLPTAISAYKVCFKPLHEPLLTLRLNCQHQGSLEKQERVQGKKHLVIKTLFKSIALM